MKIYLSPSNQPNNKYAYGNTNEKAQMERLASSLRDKLSTYNCTPILAKLSLHYSERDEEAQSKGADLYIAIHSDAGPSNAIGATAFYTTETVELAEIIIKELNAICPYPENRADQTKDGIQAGFGEIWGPKTKGIPVILVETNFHTNVNVAKWMIENINKLADAYCKAIVIKYGLKRKSIQKPSADEYYRVRKTWVDEKSQLNAYKTLSYAIRDVDKNPGYKVFDSAGIQIYPKPASTPVPNASTVSITGGIWGYKTASDALADRNRVRVVPVGTYPIMIKHSSGAWNIGAGYMYWINPAKITKVNTVVTSNQVTISKQVWGYKTASDAMSGRNKIKIVPRGTYPIMIKHKTGAWNIGKGYLYWINPKEL